VSCLATRAQRAIKDKVKLEPEVVFFEGPPHWSEVVVPAISILTVIGTTIGLVRAWACRRGGALTARHGTAHVTGIFPFAASVARQIWVGGSTVGGGGLGLRLGLVPVGRCWAGLLGGGTRRAG
jgi:hypothetical protein